MIKCAWIRLEQVHIDYGNALGLRRQNERELSGAKPSNNAPSDREWSLRKHKLGALCECAQYLYLRPCYWNRFDVTSADFEGFIEVKGRPEPWHELMIQCPRDKPKKLVRTHAYQLVLAYDHPNYCIHGWAWGHEIENYPVQEIERDRPAMYINQSDPILKSPDELREIMRERQALARKVK